MSAPDHMKGINALPKWDPSNPTKYTYDPANYDRTDYAKFKEARVAHDKAARKESLKRLKAAQKQFAKDFRQAVMDKTKEAARIKGPTRTEIDNAVREGRTLVATIPSSCFSEVYYEDGVCTAVFARDGYVWEEEMPLDDFLDLVAGPSIGQTWNAEFR